MWEILQHPSIHKILAAAQSLNFAIFLVLLVITIFRRRLSSNNEYRLRRQRFDRIRSKIKSKIYEKSIILKRVHKLYLKLYHYFNPDVVREQEKLNVNPEQVHQQKQNENKRPRKLDTLSHDDLVAIVTFLDLNDIANLSLVSKSLNRDTKSDFIWEQLWKLHFGEMWSSPFISAIRERRGIAWDPKRNYGPPQQGWFTFYLEFEYSWTNWLLAGACSREYCLVSLYGTILDITHFVGEHPGSPETLLEASGFDASENFHDIGHSIHAFRLATTKSSWRPQNYFQRRRFFKTLDEQCVGRERRFDESGTVTTFDDSDDLFATFRPYNMFQAMMLHEEKHVLNCAAEENLRAHELMHNNSNSIVSAAWSFAESSLTSLIRSATNSTTAPEEISTDKIAFNHGNKAVEVDVVTLVRMIPTLPDFLHCYVRDVSMSTASDTAAAEDPLGGVEIVEAQNNTDENGDNSTHSIASLASVSADGNSSTTSSPRSPTRNSNSKYIHLSERCAHVGQPRAYYDPLEQSWFVWWTCCGCGSAVALPAHHDIADLGQDINDVQEVSILFQNKNLNALEKKQQ